MYLVYMCVLINFYCEFDPTWEEGTFVNGFGL